MHGSAPSEPTCSMIAFFLPEALTVMTSVACPANRRYRRETAILLPQLLLRIFTD